MEKQSEEYRKWNWPVENRQVLTKLIDDCRKMDSSLRFSKRLVQNSDLSGSYSYYFIDSSSSVFQIISKAYVLASDLIKAIDVPFKLKLRLTNAYSPKENERSVCVSTNIFDVETIPLGERIDLFCADTLHEAYHAIYTPKNAMPEIGNPTVRLIAAILEDARIEHICAKETPGFLRFLNKRKYFNYKYNLIHKINNIFSDANEEERHLFRQKVLNTGVMSECLDKKKLNENEAYYYLFFDYLIKMVRCPRLLEMEDDFIFMGSYLKRVYDVIEIFPISWLEVKMAAERIYSILTLFYLKKEERHPVTHRKMNLGDDAETPQKSRTDGESNSSLSKDMVSSDLSLKAEEFERLSEKSLYSKVGTPVNKSEETNISLNGEHNGGLADSKDMEISLSSVLKDADIERVERNIEEYQKKSFGDLSLNATEPQKTVEFSHAVQLEGLQIVDGSLVIGKTPNVYFTFPKPNYDIYVRELSLVKPYISAMTQSLLSFYHRVEVTLHSQRHGKLDETKIAEAKQGIPNVYMKKVRIQTKGISVVLLLDESGSMQRMGKREAAMRSAILLSESLFQIPQMELFVYGYSADLHGESNTVINVYRDLTHHNRFTLGSLTALGNNRDGISIAEVADMVRSQTKKHVLMFVLSDGRPLANDYEGEQAIMHTKKIVEQTEKRGFSIVQICINPVCNPSSMFKRWVKFSDMESLAFDIGLLLKKEVKRLSEVSIEEYS